MPVVPAYESQTLPNGATLHVTRGGNQPIVKIDIYLAAGSLRTIRPLIASATANLLTEGTSFHSAQEIAEAMDFYGSYTWQKSSIANSSLSSLFLQKDLKHIVGLLNEILRHPAFPDQEVELYKAQELQSFDMKMMKTSFIASRALLNAIYKPGCRYGRMADRSDYENLSPQMLRDFHSEAYRPNGAHIFVTGRPSDDDIRFIAEAFGTTEWQPGDDWQAPEVQFQTEPSRTMIEYDGEQTSILVCRPLFNRFHPDALPFGMTSAVLGGYMGARLMQNIRERLGLTYGIYASLNVNKFKGNHLIQTEVKTGSHEQVVREIFNDMERLASELISEREMETLRGFMMGELLHNFDSVLNSSDTLATLMLDGVGHGYVGEFYRVARDISREEIRDMAAKWLVPSEYSVICVGKGVGE